MKQHRKQIPSAETLERLSSASRGGSSPTHDRVCDARLESVAFCHLLRRSKINTRVVELSGQRERSLLVL